MVVFALIWIVYTWCVWAYISRWVFAHAEPQSDFCHVFFHFARRKESIDTISSDYARCNLINWKLTYPLKIDGWKMLEAEMSLKNMVSFQGTSLSRGGITEKTNSSSPEVCGRKLEVTPLNATNGSLHQMHRRQHVHIYICIYIYVYIYILKIYVYIYIYIYMWHLFLMFLVQTCPNILTKKCELS